MPLLAALAVRRTPNSVGEPRMRPIIFASISGGNRRLVRRSRHRHIRVSPCVSAGNSDRHSSCRARHRETGAKRFCSRWPLPQSGPRSGEPRSIPYVRKASPLRTADAGRFQPCETACRLETVSAGKLSPTTHKTRGSLPASESAATAACPPQNNIQAERIPS